jgi:hypothetical protein
MTTEQLATFIGTLGFPIVVAGYVLIRLEKTLKDLINEVRNLRGSLERKGVRPRRRLDTKQPGAP